MKNPTRGRVSSEWSLNRNHPITGIPQTHAGIDIAAPLGTPVYAAFSGKVLSTRKNSFPGDRKLWRGAKSGNHVFIENTDGACQYYGHVQDVKVNTGDWVAEGTHIADVGNTGNSTGPHLHFETWSTDNISTHFNPRILFKEYGITPGESEYQWLGGLGTMSDAQLDTIIDNQEKIMADLKSLRNSVQGSNVPYRTTDGRDVKLSYTQAFQAVLARLSGGAK